VDARGLISIEPKDELDYLRGTMTEFLRRLLGALPESIPLLATVVSFLAALWLIDRLLKRYHRVRRSEGRFTHHLVMLGVTVLGALLCLLALPVSNETKRDLLTVFGLVLTAVLTISSTTFAANAMAGLMLRFTHSFRPGDFVRVKHQFGRVTERGLFHTEIQTEDRDLTTLPNRYLIEHPLTVVHETGTVVSATISLGYDNALERVETLLIKAAEVAGLEDPFVRILELKDFAVAYRVAGFLADVKQLLSTQSNLRRELFRTLHAADIEIASPALMIQRHISAEQRILPEEQPVSPESPEPPSPSSEERVFDKAEKAGRLEELRQLHSDLQDQVKDLEAQLEKADSPDKPALEAELGRVRKRLEGLESAWETIEERLRG
jgi:small-conductance mechanosensitive channel